MNRLLTRSFDDRDKLDQQLAATVAGMLDKAVAEKGRATLVVSGGSTPVKFFRLLSRRELPWAQVTVLLADERWVSANDDDSNEKLVRDNLLVNAATTAAFVPLKTGHSRPQEAEAELEARLATLGTFDLVILGMGNDGHTASLFPGAASLEAGLDMESGRQFIAVTPAAAPYERMSMTLPRLLDSGEVFLHITGASKRTVLERARQENDPRQLPIAAVLNQERTPVTLYYAP